MEDEKVKYVHHTLEEAVFDLVCLAYPYVKMKNLVDNLKKDCDAEIEKHKKEHKALEIIKKKEVNVAWFTYVGNLEDYNKGKFIGSYLTQEEFDLLKEELK